MPAGIGVDIRHTVDGTRYEHVGPSAGEREGDTPSQLKRGRRAANPRQGADASA